MFPSWSSFQFSKVNEQLSLPRKNIATKKNSFAWSINLIGNIRNANKEFEESRIKK